MKRFLITTFFSVIAIVGSVYASATLGTIDPSNNGSYKAEVQNTELGSAATINFGKFTTQSAKNITVSNTELRGFAWGEGVGWIVTNCADTTSGCSGTNGNFKVANDGSGNLSGYAWGENTGWINFGPFTNPAISTVKITNGEFGGTLGDAGYAWSQNFGYITFDCSVSVTCVTTDWGVVAGTFQCNDGVDNDSDGNIDYPADSGCTSATDDSEQTSGGGGGGGSRPDCRDGRDNDGDGFTDFPDDIGCQDRDDNSEDNPPITICTDPTATNTGGALPCIYPNNPVLCADVTATNFGGALPCTYPNNPPGDTRCTDPLANNVGAVLPCTYTPPPQLLCADPSALNFNQSLPCRYPSTFCEQNPTDPTCTGTNPPEQTFCEQYPELCVTPGGPGVVVGSVASVTSGFIGQIISFAGIIAVPIAGVATYFIANPFSFADIGLLLARLWSMLLIFFGLKKKSNPWGTVYDSVTKQPIDPAYVVLYDVIGNEVATSITDIEGRYGFSVPAGTYTILANKTNFEFPSKKLAGKTEDELYRDLYFGGPITVTEEGGIIAKNIPMDQLNFDWNEYAKQEQGRLRHFKRRDVLIARISSFFFIIGFIVTGVGMFVTPTTLNISMMTLYVIIAIIRITGIQIHPKGSVVDVTTERPLPFSIVRVLSSVTNKEVLHRVADARGNYYALIANGDYNITIDQKNPSGSYTSKYLTDLAHVRKGYLKEEFKI